MAKNEYTVIHPISYGAGTENQYAPGSTIFLEEAEAQQLVHALKEIPQRAQGIEESGTVSADPLNSASTGSTGTPLAALRQPFQDKGLLVPHAQAIEQRAADAMLEQAGVASTRPSEESLNSVAVNSDPGAQPPEGGSDVEDGIQLSSPQEASNGPGGNATPEAEGVRQALAADESDVQATAAARRKAAELGVDLSTVQATGAEGQILSADVEKAAQEQGG